MMNFADRNAEMEKRLANIAKLGKTELSDKTKATFVKDAVDIAKKAKTFEKRYGDLNKRIKEAKSLSADIETYRKDIGSFIKDAVAVSAEQKKITQDTKGRDYFMLATLLGMVGSSSLDDYP